MLLAKPAFLSQYCLGLLLALFVAYGASAKSDHQEPTPAKASAQKGAHKLSNDKDIVLRKNAQSTLYLLSGWGKAEGPFVWYTVSAQIGRAHV